MARGKSTEDVDLLQMALIGFQMEQQRIQTKIQELQAHLKGKRAATSAGASGEPAAAAPKKRELSEAARKRIAMAQKKRWAEHRKRAAQAKMQQAKPQTAKAGGAGASE